MGLDNLGGRFFIRFARLSLWKLQLGRVKYYVCFRRRGRVKYFHGRLDPHPGDFFFSKQFILPRGAKIYSLRCVLFIGRRQTYPAQVALDCVLIAGLLDYRYMLPSSELILPGRRSAIACIFLHEGMKV